MPVVTEHMKWRRPRNQFRHLISETDPSPQISTTIQSTRCKTTISSLLSTFSNNNNNTSNEIETTHANGQNRIKKKKKKKSNNNSNNNGNSNFSATTFRGLGCTAGASQQVSVPAVIRSSADWERNKNRKKKHRRNSNSNSNKTCHGVGVVDDVSGTCVDFQDVWCGPGIGFSADVAAASSVDCVVARKNNVSARRKLDGERITHREVTQTQ